MFKQSTIGLVLVITVVVGLGGCKTATQSDTNSPVKLVLKAAVVSKPPVINGDLSDVAWKQAIPLTAKTKGGPDVTLRAVNDASNVYIQAVWSDSTKNDMDTPWVFDGATWKKEPGDDVLILLWNIDNSIVGFNQKGASIVEQKPRSFARVRGFVIPVTKSKKGAKINQNQKADIWDLALGLTNPLDLANDLYMGIDPDYLGNPASNKAQLVTLSDSFLAGAPWLKNYAVLPDGATQPVYRFIAGRNPDNTPKPTLNDVTMIMPGDVIPIGEKSPYYIFENGKNWGGSMDDVKGKGVWKNNVWLTEMSRKLVTGNKDDISFWRASKSNYYVFSAMIRDGDSEYYTSAPIALEISK